ncbi:PEP-CTERM sorting domain-containing protein [Nitrospira sp. M1]
MQKLIILLCIITAWISPALALPLSNGGFETGSLNHWQTLGLVNVETSVFGSGPKQGNSQVFLNTEDGTSMDTASINHIEAFLGVSQGLVDSIHPAPGPSFGAKDGSAIKQDFHASAGETLSFQYNFLTSDGLWGGGVDPDASRDVSFVTLTGPNMSLGKILSNTLDIPNAPEETLVSINPFRSSPTPFNLETGFRHVSLVLPTDGNYTVGFGVVNSGFVGASSGLLVDQVSTTPSQPVPEPSTILLLTSGLIGLATWHRRQRACT